jgi:ribosomal protein L13, bacterial type
MLTYMQKPLDVQEKWYLVNAEGKTLGRLAARVAGILRGKHRPTFTPHVDMGDHIVIINAEKIHLTGNKMATKLYRRHSGFPGGLKTATAQHVFRKGSDSAHNQSDRRYASQEPTGKPYGKETPRLRRAHASAPGARTGTDYPVIITVSEEGDVVAWQSRLICNRTKKVCNCQSLGHREGGRHYDQRSTDRESLPTLPCGKLFNSRSKSAVSSGSTRSRPRSTVVDRPAKPAPYVMPSLARWWNSTNPSVPFEEGRLADTRLARQRAEKIRTEGREKAVPVLKAIDIGATVRKREGSKPSLFYVCAYRSGGTDEKSTHRHCRGQWIRRSGARPPGSSPSLF